MKALGIVVLLVGFAATLQAATTKTTLHVEGMTCAGCATAVKLVLKKTAGVASAEVSYEKKQAVVWYDASKTTPAKLAAAVTDALGYRVTVVQSTAWDISLLYAPGVRWSGKQPPPPAFWMHQFRSESGAEQRLCLNPSVFVANVASLIGTSKGGA